MSDMMDEAQELESRLTQAAVEAARAPKMREVPPGFTGLQCVDCGEPIEPLRRLSNRTRCAECQEESERVARIRRRKGEE